ncbi:serine/threonine protein kinase [Actinomycetota bacterium]|nr:serine/threonine protein kinase [Actinomycetota bacterium]
MTGVTGSNTDDERIGQTIDERYVIVSKVAHGGMATVYKAYDKRLERDVALKLMHPHLANGPEGATFISRFRREARAAARLHHPGIVTVFDQGVDNSISYLTMELVEGTNLRRRLKEVGTFAVGDALKNIENILRALAVAHHSGLVHRDIKPENILINKRGQLQITDFGLARVATEMSSTTTGTVFGTVAYLAPEIIETGNSDARSDVYSVGIMLYEMIAGQQPYAGTTPIQVAFKHVNEDVPVLSTIHPEIPRSVALLIEVFCARDESKRPINASKALELLTKVARQLTMNEVLIHLPRPELPPDDIDGASLAANAPTAYEVAEQLELNNLENQNENGYPAEPITNYDNLPSYNENDIPTQVLASDDVSRSPHLDQYSPQDQIATNMLTQSDLGFIRNESGQRIAVDDVLDGVNYSEPLPNESKSNTKRNIILSIIGVLVVALIGLVFYWYHFYGPGSQMAVPGGILRTQATAAEAKIESVGLKWTIEEVFSDTVDAGLVITTDPQSGDKTSIYGSGVKLIVSKGIESKDFPDQIVGLTLDQATTVIKTAGFGSIDSSAHAFNSSVEKGKVISVDPAQGTKNLPHNTKITLTISDGPQPYELPKVVGLVAADAAELLDEIGVDYTSTEEFSDDVAAGVIISQSTPAGTTVYEGDKLSVVVSKGSEKVEVPNVVGKSVSEATSTLEALGLKVSTTGEAILKTVQKQNVAAGTKIKKGETVSLTVV